MLKKLLFLSLPIAALVLLSFQIANADYYDCQGIRREGQPGPSECRNLRTVEETQSQYDVPREYDYPPRLTRMCGNVPCDQYQPYEPERIDPEPPTERYEEDDLYIRKVRKYCVRNYCYIIYEVCDSAGHCEEEAKRYKKDKKDWDDWRDWFKKETYDYYYRHYYYPKYRYDFVYRGSHYGRYHNRYWDF